MEKTSNIVFLRKPNVSSRQGMWSFTYPHQVVRDASLSLGEKRAILAAWASDAHAVESLPVLRHLPGTPFPVTFSSVMDAMARLDRMEGDDDPPPPPIRMRPGSPPQREAA
jgi:hypothetical protein